jgi:2-polyprenyl-3-methyl-5-hydroxy-6-metoxy-1,4-benzoquinol methylase
MLYGTEKAAGEADWKRRLGYRLFGEMHVPGRLRIWHVIRELRRLGLWRNRPLSLLDAGGGEGAFAYYAARRFPAWKVVVADNEQHTLERGRRIQSSLGLGNLHVLEADLLRMEDENAYDVIICSDVLEHIEDDERVVRNLARALRPGGHVILTSPGVPQPKHLPIVAWREKRIGFTPADYGHVRQGYSDSDLARILSAAKLEVDRIRWTFGRFGTVMFDVFFVTGDSRPNPAVYALLFPFYMGLSLLDVTLPIRHGAGILGVGRRP